MVLVRRGVEGEWKGVEEVRVLREPHGSALPHGPRWSNQRPTSCG